MSEIQRFHHDRQSSDCDGMYVASEGDYVTYDDHRAALKAVKAESQATEQKRRETENEAFHVWWQESGHAADPVFTLTMENCAHAAWQARAALEAALAAPAELHGPYGYINGHRALSEDSWEIESDPGENNEEYFSVPLFSKVDPFKADLTPLTRDESAAHWRPIAEADSGIAYIVEAGSIRIGNSYPIWARDSDGRVFECLWADDGKRAYWWDIEGESPVDPIEFMPHPLAATSTEGNADA